VPDRSRYLDVAVMASLGVGLRLAFWAYTGRVWEDALITIAHARNAVAGLGLTHHAGEPLTHGFTSALSVLIPLVGEAISRDGGLVVIRLVSLIAVIVAIAASDALGRRLGLDRWPRLLVMGYLAVDANHILYGMSGMETEVAVAALLVSVWALTARNRWMGVALGIALLARPDFILWAGIVVIYLLVRDRRRLGWLLAGSIAIVGPWLLFTTAYYGSPIPQTIVAKAIAFTSAPVGPSLGAWAEWVSTQIGAHVAVVLRTFAPFLEDSFAVRAPVAAPVLLLVSGLVVVFAIVGVVDRFRQDAWTPIIAFVGAYLVYRIFFLPPVYYDWYLPPFTAMTVLLVAAGVQRLAVGRPRTSPAIAAAFVITFAFPLPWVFQVERAIQTEIEIGVRVQTADGLASLVAPGEGVASESAGYIGWDPRVLLLDYPGLTSRTSLQAVRDLPRDGRSLEGLIDSLQPPWLVLRPEELAVLRTLYPDAAARYDELRKFGSGVIEVERGGYGKVTFDGTYIILRRTR
jgi:hypothetical protein